MRKKGLATAVLAASAAGTAGFGWLTATTGGFWFGLLAHGCLAATVGGLADWFAVTAIFRKPLGISYRTEILRRNRPRIMRSLAEFSGHDLLSRENIMKSLAHYDFSEMLAAYLTKRGGLERLIALADVMFTRGMNTLDTDGMAALLEPSVRRICARIRLDVMANDALSSALSPETNAKILRAILPIARNVWNDAEFQNALLNAIAHIREAYVGDQAIRASLFDMEELSEERLLARLNDYAETWLDAWERGENEAYAHTLEWLNHFLQNEEQISRLLSVIRNWQQQRLKDADIRSHLAHGLETLRASRLLIWRRELRAWLERLAGAFLSDVEARNRFNAWILRWMDSLLTAHHAKLPDMMERQLARLTDDALVNLVETRVEDDLQMIRINGAAVGSLAGMLLYLLTMAAERMWA